MVSRITISGLIVHAVIGVYAFEQSITQPLKLDISFSADVVRAACDDALSDTCDYAAVCRAVSVFAEEHECRLLETFAKRLSDHLVATFQVTDLQLSVTKKPKDLPNVEGVTVMVCR